MCIFYGLTVSLFSAEPDPTIQLAGQDIRATEAAGLHDLLGGTSIAVLKVL